MIRLTRLDGKELVVNSDHILTVEATPDTVILLTSGQKLMVAESVTEVIDEVATWRRRIHAGPFVVHDGDGLVLSLPRGAPPLQQE